MKCLEQVVSVSVQCCTENFGMCKLFQSVTFKVVNVEEIGGEHFRIDNIETRPQESIYFQAYKKGKHKCRLLLVQHFLG